MEDFIKKRKKFVGSEIRTQDLSSTIRRLSHYVNSPSMITYLTNAYIQKEKKIEKTYNKVRFAVTTDKGNWA